MELWPFVGAVVMPLAGIVALVVLVAYAVVFVAYEVRGELRRRRWRRARELHDSGQG